MSPNDGNYTKLNKNTLSLDTCEALDLICKLLLIHRQA